MKKNILYFFSVLMLTTLFSTFAYAGCAPGESYVVITVNSDAYFAGDGSIITVTIGGVQVYTGTPPDSQIDFPIVDGCFPEGAAISVDFMETFGDGILVDPPVNIVLGCDLAPSTSITQPISAMGNIFMGTVPVDFDDNTNGTTGSGEAIGTSNPASSGISCPDAASNTANFGAIAVSPTLTNSTSPPGFPSGITGYPVCDVAGGATFGQALTGTSSTTGETEPIEVCSNYTQPNVSGNETGVYIGVLGDVTEIYGSTPVDMNGDGNGVNDCGFTATDLTILDAGCNVVASNVGPTGATGLTPGTTYTVCVTIIGSAYFQGADGQLGTGDDGAPADGTCVLSNIGIGVQPFESACVPSTVSQAVNLCPGDSYTSPITGTVYTASGTEAFTDANGCPATLTVTITPLVPIDAAEAADLCPGDSYTASTGTMYTASGTEMFTDANGCDAALTVTITPLVPMDADEAADLCPGDSYTASTGTMYTASGTEMFTDANGCDATLTVTITPLVPIDAAEAADLCPGDSYTASTGTMYTASGTETFTDANGCDATLTVTITPLVPADVSEMATLCAQNGDTYTSPTTGTVYTASGTETFTDAAGCTATLTVTIMDETPACGDPTATNYDMNATCIDNTLCTFGEYCDNICFAEYAPNPAPNDTPNVTLCITPLGCADLATIDPSCISTQACDDGDPCTENEEATVILADNSVCMDCGLNATPVTAACGDPAATNYDMDATCIDNTLCTYGEYCDNICFAEYVPNPGPSDVANATLCVTPLGCADLATIDPSCISTQACDDGDPCTENEEATVILADNSVCADCGLNATPVTAACGDPTAINYDMNATCIDNTLCTYVCEDGIAGSITFADCDFSGTMVEIFDANGVSVGVVATDAMGNYSLTGLFTCGTYSAIIIGAPACYTDAGGDVGPRTFIVDGDGTPDGFNFSTPLPDIPTVGEWGLIILGLLMSITAIVGIRQRREEENKVWS